MNNRKSIHVLRYVGRYLRRAIAELSKNPNKHVLERLQQRSDYTLKMVESHIKENDAFEEEIKELKGIISMRLSPNEIYSSETMDSMIVDKVKNIIKTFQEQP